MRKGLLCLLALMLLAGIPCAFAEVETADFIKNAYGRELLGYVTPWKLADWFSEEEVPADLNENLIFWICWREGYG